MKKYRVTEMHPYLKEGVISYWNQHDELSYTRDNDNSIYFLNYDKLHKNAWLKDGWIEEIQEPEYTRDDFWSYYKFLFRTTMIVTKESFEKTLNVWQNENKTN